MISCCLITLSSTKGSTPVVALRLWSTRVFKQAPNTKHQTPQTQSPTQPASHHNRFRFRGSIFAAISPPQKPILPPLEPSFFLNNPRKMAFLTPCAVPTRKATSTALTPRRQTTPRPRRTHLRATPVARVGTKRTGDEIRGKVFVVRDNIDTDQIIPAEYLTLVPSDPEEYRKLGSYALVGLPADQYKIPYVKPGEFETEYPIIIAGDNFGCGSSREHAPVALGACGGCAVVAQSYARIFFRNCSATGELYPWESQERLVEEFETGDVGVIDFKECVVRNERTGREYKLNELGDVQPVIDAGGIFEYARQSGMISKN